MFAGVVHSLHDCSSHTTCASGNGDFNHVEDIVYLDEVKMVLWM